MKLLNAIENLGPQRSISFARCLAPELGIAWEGAITVIFSTIVDDPDRVPGNIGGTHDSAEVAIGKWLTKYQRGKEGRASQRISNPPGTIADPIIEEIIGARIGTLTREDLVKITYAHRLGMSAENILGLMLEEYLAESLEQYGWHCAWGETVRSVDFVHEDGRLLQIKNRSNSENSSSSAIRHGTKIEKWYRVKANKVEYMWDSLNEICGITILSEEAFVGFVRKTIMNNPGCLAVEQDNPWDNLY